MLALFTPHFLRLGFIGFRGQNWQWGKPFQFYSTLGIFVTDIRDRLILIHLRWNLTIFLPRGKGWQIFVTRVCKRGLCWICRIGDVMIVCYGLTRDHTHSRSIRLPTGKLSGSCLKSNKIGGIRWRRYTYVLFKFNSSSISDIFPYLFHRLFWRRWGQLSWPYWSEHSWFALNRQ